MRCIAQTQAGYHEDVRVTHACTHTHLHMACYNAHMQGDPLVYFTYFREEPSVDMWAVEHISNMFVGEPAQLCRMCVRRTRRHASSGDYGEELEGSFLWNLLILLQLPFCTHCFQWAESLGSC